MASGRSYIYDHAGDQEARVHMYDGTERAADVPGTLRVLRPHRMPYQNCTYTLGSLPGHHSDNEVDSSDLITGVAVCETGCPRTNSPTR